MRHLHKIDSYDNRVEEQLRDSMSYYVSQIGRIVSHRPTEDALVERWCPETNTFHLPHGECTITLEKVTMIRGFQTDGLSVIGSTDHISIAPEPNDHKGSGIKLAWFCTLKWCQHLTDQVSKDIYVKCHIMYLFSTTLFSDKSGISVHWKYLPLLRDFSQIHKFSWGFTCLAHM
ncbi:hypothetical protein AHAS_Ahas17G0136400 [Arachis hypogaea]